MDEDEPTAEFHPGLGRGRSHVLANKRGMEAMRALVPPSATSSFDLPMPAMTYGLPVYVDRCPCHDG